MSYTSSIPKILSINVPNSFFKSLRIIRREIKPKKLYKRILFLLTFIKKITKVLKLAYY